MARAGAVAELGATTSGRLEVTLCGMAFLPGRNSPSLDLCKAKVVHLSPRSDDGQGGVGFRKLSRKRVGEFARWPSARAQQSTVRHQSTLFQEPVNHQRHRRSREQRRRYGAIRGVLFVLSVICETAPETFLHQGRGNRANAATRCRLAFERPSPAKRGQTDSMDKRRDKHHSHKCGRR